MTELFLVLSMPLIEVTEFHMTRTILTVSSQSQQIVNSLYRRCRVLIAAAVQQRAFTRHPNVACQIIVLSYVCPCLQQEIFALGMVSVVVTGAFKIRPFHNCLCGWPLNHHHHSL